MKKKLILAAALAVAVLAGAAVFLGSRAKPAPKADAALPETQAVPETVPETDPAPTEPEWEPGISRATFGEAVYDYLELGTEVDIAGEFRDYYVIAGEACDLLVEKRFVRLEGEEPFESWVGYAAQGTRVFESVYMSSERDNPIAELAENTPVNVVEGKGDWLYLQWEAGEGYVHADQISQWRITHGGGGESAPSDGTDVPVDSLTASGFRGGIVLLGAYDGPEPEEKFEEGKGLVIAHDIEAYIRLFSRGEEVKVTGYDESCTVYLDGGLTAQLPRWLLRLAGDEEYESWTGYAQSNALVYEEYQMRNEIKTLTVNTEILVLDKLPECYVVMVEGETGYMELDAVSETEIVNYGGETGGGGSDEVWTPPAL